MRRKLNGFKGKEKKSVQTNNALKRSSIALEHLVKNHKSRTFQFGKI